MARFTRHDNRVKPEKSGVDVQGQPDLISLAADVRNIGEYLSRGVEKLRPRALDGHGILFAGDREAFPSGYLCGGWVEIKATAEIIIAPIEIYFDGSAPSVVGAANIEIYDYRHYYGNPGFIEPPSIVCGIGYASDGSVNNYLFNRLAWGAPSTYSFEDSLDRFLLLVNEDNAAGGDITQNEIIRVYWQALGSGEGET